jgi:hypothetical protein
MEQQPTIKHTKCPKPPGYVYNEHTNTYIQLGCNTYSCPVCGPKKVARFKRAIRAWMKLNRINRIWTITATSEIGTPETHWKIMKEAWTRTIKDIRRLKKFSKKPVRYIAIRELHKSGYVHLHVLVSHYIRVELIQGLFDAHWRKVAFSLALKMEAEGVEPSAIEKIWNTLRREKVTNVHMERVFSPRGITNYMAKYLTKAIAQHTELYKQRYTHSAGRIFPEKKKTGEWEFVFDVPILDSSYDCFSKEYTDIDEWTREMWEYIKRVDPEIYKMFYNSS